MKKNINFVEKKYQLIKCILSEVNKNILDVSCSFKDNHIDVQIISLKKDVSTTILNNLEKEFCNFDISIIEHIISKDQYNENAGEWLPKHYKWLDFVILSKAEIL